MLQIQESDFQISVHHMRQLPDPDFPEFAFAGRSNVGKSSLMNRLIGRRGFVKVSGRPGKTQGLNYFLINKSIYLVDLPGYGYAKVSKSIQDGWQKLITQYLETRESLLRVVIIIDIRHGAKKQDIQLISWLRTKNIQMIPVYTKADKLSGNQRNKQASLLDAGLGIHRSDRIIFSAKSGMGVEDLKMKIFEAIEEY